MGSASLDKDAGKVSPAALGFTTATCCQTSAIRTEQLCILLQRTLRQPASWRLANFLASNWQKAFVLALLIVMIILISRKVWKDS